jgi:hypothetical protein
MGTRSGATLRLDAARASQTTNSASRRKPGLARSSGFWLALFAVAITTTLIVRAKSRHAPSPPAEEPEVGRPPSAAGPRTGRVVMSHASVTARAETDPHHEEAREKTHTLLTFVSTKLLNDAQTLEPLGMESVGNMMEGYLLGALTTVKVMNPEAYRELQTGIADHVCGNIRGDVELMMVAKMMIIDPGVGSPRALDCAFARHQKEDVLLWTLLDAWKGTGQVATQTLREIQGRAVDERTKLRFLSRDEEDALRTSRISSQQNQPTTGRDP